MSEQRQRATAILIRDGDLLLVRDRDRSSFALPGGGVDPGELPISAVARELYEE
ncbi:MAG: NUDIX domain-containing protein, partial [Chloroflexi bacterium]|nr:NUDIX domain-containing protein [Chloroflexota bacterium]